MYVYILYMYVYVGQVIKNRAVKGFGSHLTQSHNKLKQEKFKYI